MEFDFFYGFDHPLSQWYYSDFEIDGILFNCCEQWMMYSKAILFNDFEKAQGILKESKANIQRKLGRQILYFKEETWLKNRVEIVYQGNLAKFSQNDQLKCYILGTSNKYLAEASPNDLIWGIGFSTVDENRLFKEKWRGQNMLGEILMKIRDEID